MRGVNLTLFRGMSAAVAGALVLAALVLVLVRDGSPGWTPEGYDLLVPTGLATLALFAVTLGYVARKYMHKLGYSPEFRMRVALKELEAFDERLNQMRVEVLQGTLTDKREIEREARRHLRETGVQRIVRVDVLPGTGEGPAFLLQARPTEPLGRAANWLHAHVFFGLASGLLVWLHGGGRFDQPMGLLLNAFSILVVVTGALGAVLWALGPTWLSVRERKYGLSIEQAFVLHESYEKKLEEGLEELDVGTREVLGELRQRGVAEYADAARQAAAALVRTRSPKLAEAQELMTLTGQFVRVRAATDDLMRVRLRFMLWRIVHIPAAIVLLGLILLHLWSVWKY